MKLGRWLSAGPPRQLRALCSDLLRAERGKPEPASVAELTNSPLLATLTERLAAAGRCEVLDLGPAIGANVAFFGELHCRLHIADCAAPLMALNARMAQGLAEDGSAAALAPGDELVRLLPLEPGAPLDAILVWDLLNYLDQPLFKALMTHLAPWVSGDTWLHGYVCSRREMAALPSRYRLTPEGRLAVTAGSVGRSACPAYTQSELRNLMPQFSVARSMLLQNGMQEYLFKGHGLNHRAGR
jgi:hypothetical protein